MSTASATTTSLGATWADDEVVPSGVRWLREPFSGLSHLVAAVAAAVGTGFLVAGSAGQVAKVLAVLVYGVSMVALFSASATYHLFTGSEAGLDRLHRLDHAAIYLLIAGTFTPLTVVVSPGAWGWVVFGIIWGIAAIGLVLKLGAGTGPRSLTTVPYLVMGWFGLTLFRDIYLHLPRAALFLMILGGVFYSVGALMYALRRPDPFPGRFGFHEIWHVFVIGGAASHFALIMGYVVPYVPGP
jgi:hemolysin III